MTEPKTALKKPCLVTLPRKGRRHFWCACGLSRKQPFCDGSHTGTGIEPVAYVAQEDGEEVLFCGCKQTRNAPLCDGSHNNLDDSYEEASAEEIAATAHIPLTEPMDGKAMLDGGCYVLTPDDVPAATVAGWRVRDTITADSGAQALSQFLLQADAPTGALTFGDSEAVLGVLSGHGRIDIAGRPINVIPECGVYVAPGEAVTATPEGGVSLVLLAAVCPQGPRPAPASRSPDFRSDIPDRVVPVDPAQRQTMADRFYQVLIGDGAGSTQVTQFIGEIPRSRAAYHRHLYEETITILSGSGYMWTEAARAAVRPGDVIFLPRKQRHSLECTDPAGMRLMGVFYPSGSPAVNY